jgi:hypothetical protein
MAQNYTIDSFDSSHVAQTDLQNMENNFAALKSSFSGASAPGNTVAGMLWKDTTKNLLKVRNYNDSAWLGIMQASTSQKILVYRNAAETGWAIDSTETDKVIALKGGSTYTTGGATAGSWTLPDYTLAEADVPAHTHGSGQGAHTHDVYIGDSGGASTANGRTLSATTILHTLISDAAASAGAHEHASFGGGGAHNHGSTYRPAAIVCTMQYLSI